MCVHSLGYIVGASPPLKICVFVRWVTLWVHPPCENMCVRLLGYIVGASPPLQYLDSILNRIFNPILNPILKPNIDCPLQNKCFPLHPKKLFTPPKFTCSGRIFSVAVFFSFKLYSASYSVRTHTGPCSGHKFLACKC